MSDLDLDSIEAAHDRTCTFCGNGATCTNAALVAALREARAATDNLTRSLMQVTDDAHRIATEREEERAEVERLREAEDEGDQVRSRMADLLSRVAVALNGPEPELTMWSWHDLPEKAEAQVVAKDHFAEAAALNGRQRDDWRRRYEALRDGVTSLCDDPHAYYSDGRRWVAIHVLRVVVDPQHPGDES